MIDRYVEVFACTKDEVLAEIGGGRKLIVVRGL